MSHPTIATATVAACFSVTAQSLIQQLVSQGTRIVGFGRPGDEARTAQPQRCADPGQWRHDVIAGWRRVTET